MKYHKIAPMVVAEIMYPRCLKCGGEGFFNARKCERCNGTGRKNARCGNNCA